MDRVSSHSPAGVTQRRLLDAAQHGERAALQELVRRYEPLVNRVVWRLHPPLGCEREDLAQEARIGLILAIRAWRPERGPFPAFADRCVRNQALLAAQAAARHKHQLLSRAVSLYGQYGGDARAASDRGDFSLVDALAARSADGDPEARLLIVEQLTSLAQAVSTLTASERVALAGTLNGKTHERLALVVGGTPKAVSQAAYRARRKLAAALPRAC
jgi:RNA polymerase sporulation-specific sigma factor